jgi:RimJ/RimL family protein N-acetyltransferase
MLPAGAVRPTPWDRAAFGFDTFEIVRPDAEVLREAARTPGHYTVRIDPLASKRSLHEHGFYYCDTLLEPACGRGDLIAHPDARAALSPAPLATLEVLCGDAFRHDRFHRDFNIDPAMASRRYVRWLRELHGQGKVHGLAWEGRPAGFIALDGQRMVLHAVSGDLRGRGIAKHLWTVACMHFFGALGLEAVDSSISASNLAAVNLYACLGFRFRAAHDLYHLHVRQL